MNHFKAMKNKLKELMEAFEWLRDVALDGNKHAAVLLHRLSRLEKFRVEAMRATKHRGGIQNN